MPTGKREGKPYTQRGDIMLCSEKKKLGRRVSIMAAVRSALKAEKAFVQPQALRALADAIDPRDYYYVRIIRSAKDAAKALVLERETGEHSGCTETARCAFGDVVFGEDDWSPGAPAYCDYRHYTAPEFETDEVFVVLKHRVEETYYQYDTDTRETGTIIIYVPEVL
jgi:hypothetical protein